MRIEIPIGGIVIELGSPDPDTPGSFLGGTIVEGSLKEDCDGSDDFNKMMDALESIILSHACAGIDVTSPAYIEGLETAIAACANHS